jgi:threonyl-tRNA synthetase
MLHQMALPEKAAVEPSDWKPLETIVNNIVKEKQVFERLTLSKEDL